MTPEQEKIYEAIQQERHAQDVQWGEQDHTIYKWLAILGEEVGEANKAALESDIGNYEQELEQIAAVAVAMLEALGRARKNKKES